MAKQTWNVDRQKGGSYEFSLDANGNYKLNSVGFNQVKTLNLPELKKEDTKTTTTPKDTKTASAQTKEAFGDVQPFYYRGGGADKQYTTEYQMTKDKSLATDQAMTKGAWDKGQWGPKPETRGAWDERQWGPQPSKGTPISAVDKARVTAGEFINKIDDKSTAESGMQFTDPAPTKVDQQQKEIDTFGTGQWGPKPSSGMPVDTTYRSQTQKFKERFDPTKIQAAPQKVAPLKKVTQVTKTALKKVNTALKPLAKAVGFVLSPVSSAIGMVAGAFKETDQHKHDKAYFSKTNGILENGRIAGNASTSVFAGLNSVSAFGNLSKTAANRIATRNKTIATKNVSQKFIDDTKNMEKEQKEHARSQAAAKNAKDLSTGGVAPGASGGGSGGGGKSRVICTELHSTGEMSTRDWLRDIKFTYKDLSKEHIKGYLLWAVPTVEHIKKYPTYRKFWKHLAQHRANDITWRLNQGKFDLLGRIYAGIGEPLCWLIGKCISDKQIKELELNNWRKT